MKIKIICCLLLSFLFSYSVCFSQADKEPEQKPKLLNSEKESITNEELMIKQQMIDLKEELSTVKSENEKLRTQIDSQSSYTRRLPEFKINPIPRNGFSVALYCPFGFSKIINLNFEKLTVASNNFTWNTESSFAFSGGIGFYYFFNSHMAIKSGIVLNNIESTYSLSGAFQETKLSTDLNDNSFNKRIEADYDSLVSIQYFALPLLFNFTSGTPGKLSFFFEAGPQFSFAISASSKVSGEYEYLGYYPYSPPILQYRRIPEFGFYNDADIDRKHTPDVRKINLSVYGSFGINIPIGLHSSIQIGPEAIIGISDIQSKKSDYIDIFGNRFDQKPTKINKYGMRIGLVYKL